MPEYPPLTESYAKIQAWARAHAPDITFRPPAEPTAIDNFATESGLTIPEDLRSALLVADGETPNSGGMIGNWRILPIAEIQGAWGLLAKLAKKDAFAGLEPEAPLFIRDAWWHTGWIPIVESGTGDFFCLDAAPPDPDRTGQVLLFLQNRPERPLVAGSLRAWFDRIARDLAEGAYAYDEEAGFNSEALMWSSLQKKHLFDGFEGKMIV
ncbi:MAG: SMI1/KNR4 family protein [Chloroflexota bacterium]|jgi:cell wall assembly regulator SMI1|nr:SMI1/KNR4 family protein [Chloroflexota bacterium]